ncbi:GNAT family N-acetyltransferase [Hyphobacterium marinum]|uniref:GNAT family N-acetyltransferase n=1 Tax=Hyphobacterium marinum TaxID=3116574 RepID=A0ABU7LZ17_9PROT|nr:GNAT family N-acetyltransferase [Hyphobacterium sp. Y6023]MEE2566802.1 GNAT family N-acetyltransferase [Hyphobacterium sp. Y6023]
MTVTVAAEDPRSDDARALIAALDAELSGLYEPQFNHFVSGEGLAGPGMRFFVARDGSGQPVGCVAMRPYEGFAEIKRMFVAHGARGQGISRLLLDAVHDAARADGFEFMRLETGDQQLAAIGLYESAGYRRCPAFGDYPADSPHNFCYEIRLSPAETMVSHV